jgi:hypothetical protein
LLTVQLTGARNTQGLALRISPASLLTAFFYRTLRKRPAPARTRLHIA